MALPIRTERIAPDLTSSYAWFLPHRRIAATSLTFSVTGWPPTPPHVLAFVRFGSHDEPSHTSRVAGGCMLGPQAPSAP